MKTTVILAFLAAVQSAVASPLYGRQFLEPSSQASDVPFGVEAASSSSTASTSATPSSSSTSDSSTASTSTTPSSSSTLDSSSTSNVTSTSSAISSSSTSSSNSTTSAIATSSDLNNSSTATSTSTTTTLLTASATATPTSGLPSVTQILQLALTLEHLESTFYAEGLANFSISNFSDVGLPVWAYGRFEQIAEHEATHVEFLTSVLGNDSVAACNYSFPVNSPWEFVALSEMLESVGEAAYIGGGASLASNTDALTAAAAIIPVEARHASWIQAMLYMADPWNSAFDTPISANLAYTLASTFITDCPSSNPQLPFTAFPSLNVTGLTQPSMLTNGSSYAPTKGQNVNFAYDNSTANGKAQYAAFLTGLNTFFAPLDGNQTAIIPTDLQGLVFTVITTNDTVLSDEEIVAGPATLNFYIGSNATALY